MNARSNGWLLLPVLAATACSTAQPQLNPPTGTGASGGVSSGGTTVASASSSSGGSTGGVAATGGGTTSGGSTGGGGTTTGGSCEAPITGFAGSWDTAFAQLNLDQDGGFVWGRYHDWGYTDQDPQFAGTLQGTVCGIALTGTLQSNLAPAPAGLQLILELNELKGNFAYPGQGPDPILGVPSDAGIALPFGSGWSFENISINLSGLPFEMTMVQTGDVADGAVLQENLNSETPIIGVHGVVSDYRLNGEYVPLPGNGSPGRISFAMTPDGTQFSGNSMHNSAVFQWCGGTQGNLPTVCLGGGGGYDGTWFTNLGTITLSQPLLSSGAASEAVTGVWFYWGSQTETAIAGEVTDGLSWSDSSDVGGAVALLHDDPIGLTLQGFTAAGGIWCGATYNMDAGAPYGSDAGATYGTLPLGCGLSNRWEIAQGPGATAVLDLTQVRGQVAGGVGALAISGSVAANPDGGAQAPVLVSGSWSGAGSGTFTWYPDADDLSFAGDSNSAGTVAGWCGSVSGVPPAVCRE